MTVRNADSDTYTELEITASVQVQMWKILQSAATLTADMNGMNTLSPDCRQVFSLS